MKLLQIILFSILMGLAVAGHAVSQQVQVDLLMSKITSALKSGSAADALPFFAELEGMEPSLAKPLPESFHFFYIDTLDKTGDSVKALRRAEIYMNKYSEKGKYYGQVIEIMGRLQMQIKKEAKETAERNLREAQVAAERRDREVKEAAEERNRNAEKLARQAQEKSAREEQARIENESHCNNYRALKQKHDDLGRQWQQGNYCDRQYSAATQDDKRMDCWDELKNKIDRSEREASKEGMLCR